MTEIRSPLPPQIPRISPRPQIKKGEFPQMKKIISLILALTMVFALAVTASAVTVNIPAASDNVANGTYTAYKVFAGEFSADGASHLYSIVEGDPFWDVVETSNLFVKTQVGTSTTYRITAAEGTTADAIATLLSGSNAKGTGIELKYSNGNFTATIPDDGYYYIESSFDDHIIINTLDDADATNGIITIQPKEKYPSLTKKIVLSDGSLVDEISAAVGDTVTFTLTVEIPAGCTEFYVYDDVPSGLFFSHSNIQAPENWQTVFEQYNNPGNGADVGWRAKGTGYPTPCTVTVTYSVTVTDDAVVGNNVNRAWVTYNEVELEDTATVKINEFTLKKVDDKNTQLEGAEFVFTENMVYPTPTVGGNFLHFSKNVVDGVTVYTYSGSNLNESDEKIDDSAVINAGNVKIKGLPSGRPYYLWETKAPGGYNKLTSAITITVDQDGNITSNDLDGTVLTVINETGTVLPSTGGMGTTLFYVLGSLMAVTALVVLVTNKRMRT